MARMIFGLILSLMLFIQGMMMIEAMMTSGTASAASNGLKGDLTYYKGNNWHPVVVVGDENNDRMAKWIKRKLNVDDDDDDDGGALQLPPSSDLLDFRRLSSVNENRAEADGATATTTTATAATTSTLPLLNDRPALIKFSAIYLMNPIKDEIDFIGEKKATNEMMNNDDDDEEEEEDDIDNEIADEEEEDDINNQNRDKLHKKRNRKNTISGWEKRRSAVWNKFRGAWGKREPRWNNLKGMWGKRIDGNWKKLQSAWGKRSDDAGDADKKSLMLAK